MKNFKVFISVLFMFTLVACVGMEPKSGSWESPTEFTEEQVFSAAIKSGRTKGWNLAASDRETGIIQLNHTSSNLSAALSVVIERKDINGNVFVNVTLTYGGKAAIYILPGQHEKDIINYYNSLFENLGIKNINKTNIIIK